MGIIISRTDAKLGMETSPSKFEMQTRNARFELTRRKIELNIHSELPKVEIDQYEAFASAGLKGPVDLSREYAQRGQQQVLEYIGKIAEDGDRLAAIENGGNPIADIAERDAYPEHEFNIDFIPKARPRIEVRGSISMNPDTINDLGVRNTITLDYLPGEVNINYTPSKLKIYMQQYASLDIKFQPENKINVLL